MEKCIIFCAGEFDAPVEPVEKTDLVIAADGGLRHAQRLGLTPDVVLGDFDSLGYTPAGAAVFPVDKDDTDAMLAVKAGLARGCREFLIYGGLDGSRLDHTVANFQTLAYLAEHGARGTLAGLHHIAAVIRNGQMRFPPRFQGIVSVFCLGRDARGVCISGLRYPLENGVLTSGFPLGVSNHFTGCDAAVSVEDGTLLLIWQRRNGLAEP